MPASTPTREIYGLTLLQSSHQEMRRLKRAAEQPAIHGNKFWGASYLLMDYLQNNPLEAGSRVLELGCGWGLGGIYCARHFDADVVAIDADPAVFPYLQAHAEENGVNIHSHDCFFRDISVDDMEGFDVIIGADICFWDDLGDELYELIDRAIEAGVKQIILTDPEREPFVNLAEACVDEHFAELTSVELEQPEEARGCVLVIENA